MTQTFTYFNLLTLTINWLHHFNGFMSECQNLITFYFSCLKIKSQRFRNYIISRAGYFSCLVQVWSLDVHAVFQLPCAFYRWSTAGPRGQSSKLSFCCEGFEPLVHTVKAQAIFLLRRIRTPGPHGTVSYFFAAGDSNPWSTRYGQSSSYFFAAVGGLEP